jgi:hypothetical protein
MRLPRVRFRIRWLLVAVALVALLLGGVAAWWRHEERGLVHFYLQQSGFFAEMERDFLQRATAIESGASVAIKYPGEPQGRDERSVWLRKQASAFARNTEFFRGAAARPWQPLQPVSPVPIP